jgi:hypothetical protein
MKIDKKLLLPAGTTIVALVTAYRVTDYYVLTDYGASTMQAALFTASKAIQCYLD